jgi:hypothetical protein
MNLRPNNPLLVACRTRREWNDDDAVASCRLIFASSFRAFYSGEHEMRRVSKREIGFRFGLVDEVRVPVIHRERKGAEAKLEGVDCDLALLPDEWNDLARPGVIRARLSFFPERQGNGWLPKGTKPDPDAFSFTWRRTSKVSLDSAGVHSDAKTLRYEVFAKRYPVGSLVEARVLAQSANKVRLELPGGLIIRMASGDYWNRWPSCHRTDVHSIEYPERIEVIVRRLNPDRQVIVVTMHGYPRDPKYCNAASGYRSAYNAREGMFVRLPWEMDATP